MGILGEIIMKDSVSIGCIFGRVSYILRYDRMSSQMENYRTQKKL